MIESRLGTVDSCFDLVSARLVGEPLTKKHMVMTSDETQIHMPTDWSMSHAKLVAPNNRQTSEYHVVFAMGKNFLSYARYFHCYCHATWLPCKPRNRESASTFSLKRSSQKTFLIAKFKYVQNCRLMR